MSVTMMTVGEALQGGDRLAVPMERLRSVSPLSVTRPCNAGEPVVLRAYDLSNGKVAKIAPFVMRNPIDAVWHTAIFVYGIEYFYGGYIGRTLPAQVEAELGLTASWILDLGRTTKSKRELEKFLSTISEQFTPDRYDLSDWNCNNFSNEVVKFLLPGQQIPRKIRELPARVNSSLVGRLVMRILKRQTATQPVLLDEAARTVAKPSTPPRSTPPETSKRGRPIPEPKTIQPGDVSTKGAAQSERPGSPFIPSRSAPILVSPGRKVSQPRPAEKRVVQTSLAHPFNRASSSHANMEGRCFPSLLPEQCGHENSKAWGGSTLASSDEQGSEKHMPRDVNMARVMPISACEPLPGGLSRLTGATSFFEEQPIVHQNCGFPSALAPHEQRSSNPRGRVPGASMTKGSGPAKRHARPTVSPSSAFESFTSVHATLNQPPAASLLHPAYFFGVPVSLGKLVSQRIMSDASTESGGCDSVTSRHSRHSRHSGGATKGGDVRSARSPSRSNFCPYPATAVLSSTTNRNHLSTWPATSMATYSHPQDGLRRPRSDPEVSNLSRPTSLSPSFPPVELNTAYPAYRRMRSPTTHGKQHRENTAGLRYNASQLRIT